MQYCDCLSFRVTIFTSCKSVQKAFAETAPGLRAETGICLRSIGGRAAVAATGEVTVSSTTSSSMYLDRHRKVAQGQEMPLLYICHEEENA